MDEAEQLLRSSRRDGSRQDRRGRRPARPGRAALGRASPRATLRARRLASEPLQRPSSTLAERVEVLPDRVLLYVRRVTTRCASPRRGDHAQSALVRRSSLEDVFLRLTGRTLVDCVDGDRLPARRAAVAAQLVTPRDLLRPDLARVGPDHGALPDLLPGRPGRGRWPHGARSTTGSSRARPTCTSSPRPRSRRRRCDWARASRSGPCWRRSSGSARTTRPRRRPSSRATSWPESSPGSSSRALFTGVVYTIVIGASARCTRGGA